MAYVYSYYLHPAVPEILQVSSDKFQDTILLDKQPVVVEDGGAGFMRRMLSTFTITNNQIQPPTVSEWHKNKYKFLAIQAGDKQDVLVCPATIKRDESGAPVNESSILAFRMSPGQTLIIPFHWLYYFPTPDGNQAIAGIHDVITYFLP